MASITVFMKTRGGQTFKCIVADVRLPGAGDPADRRDLYCNYNDCYARE